MLKMEINLVGSDQVDLYWFFCECPKENNLIISFDIVLSDHSNKIQSLIILLDETLPLKHHQSSITMNLK